MSNAFAKSKSANKLRHVCISLVRIAHAHYVLMLVIAVINLIRENQPEQFYAVGLE